MEPGTFAAGPTYDPTTVEDLLSGGVEGAHAGAEAPVFLIGSQRSGTTWLQCLLGAHPAIAAPQEPEFFTRYVRPWHRAWSHEIRAMADEASSSRLKGVSSVMTTAQFAAMVRGAVHAFHAAILELKPGARVVMEKCPEYHRSVHVITTYLPEARFIHLVRDGRDVVSSLVAASRGWGRQWAPTGVEEAAAMWVRAVENARTAKASGRYLELRYEDLLADGPSVLGSALAFCGAAVDPDEARALCDRFSFDALKTDPSRPYRSLVVGGELTARLGDSLRFPEGFFREGRAGSWRESWSAVERSTFDRVAGDLLVDLGYEKDHAWATLSRRDRVRAALARARATTGRVAARTGRAARAARRELSGKG